MLIRSLKSVKIYLFPSVYPLSLGFLRPRQSTSMAKDKKKISLLEDLRIQIDHLDEEILSLIYQRQSLVKQVAIWKSQNSVPVLDSSRESEKLEKLSQLSSIEDFPKIRKVFESIMDFSKQLQTRPDPSEIRLNVGIVGMGLMGGSFYKAFKKYHPHIDLYCWDVNDSPTWDMAQIEDLLNCQVLVLCMPPQQIIVWLEEHGGKISKDCMVIDISSTKKQISDFISVKKEFQFSYLPGHPIVGKETSGFESSESDLFLNKTIILGQPLDKIPKSVLDILNGIGLKCHYMANEEHDRVFADLSHLPHFVALALILNSEEALAHGVIPRSFKDLTRIAGASGSLWQDIFLTNQDNINSSIKNFIAVLESLVADPSRLIENYVKANRLLKENMDDHSYGKIPHRKSVA